MVPRKQCLIVNISSGAGLGYVYNSASGIGKACDRMAADCGLELKSHNVAFVSLWLANVCTETVLRYIDQIEKTKKAGTKTLSEGEIDKVRKLYTTSETPEFTGQCIAALATDPELIKMSGKILLTYDLGKKYKLNDAVGHSPVDMCNAKSGFRRYGQTWLAAGTPNFVRLPKWVLTLGCSKFN